MYDEMIEKLLKKQENTEERLNNFDATRTTTSRKGKLQALLKDASEKVQKRYVKDFDRMNFKDDDDFDSWLEETKPMIVDDMNTEKAVGAASHSPKGGARTASCGIDPAINAYLNDELDRENEMQISTMSGMPEQKRRKEANDKQNALEYYLKEEETKEKDSPYSTIIGL